MELIGEKIIRLQDSKYKIKLNNNNEASIFLQENLANKLNLIDKSNTKFILIKLI